MRSDRGETAGTQRLLSRLPNIHTIRKQRASADCVGKPPYCVLYIQGITGA